MLSSKLKRFTAVSLLTLFAFTLLTAYLSPFAYMTSTAFKDLHQFSRPDAPLWPAQEKTFTWQGKAYPLYHVPFEDGERILALVKKGREESRFVDPQNPEAGEIVWKGRWRTLDPVWEFSPRWENFPEAWEAIDFPRLFRNTLIIATVGMIGTLLSSIAVAYGLPASAFRAKRSSS